MCNNNIQFHVIFIIVCSEKTAMESIYSVSTKYYYAFSCSVTENVTHKIKCTFSLSYILNF